ncbi:MAG: hypothetical protein MUF54_25885, partial [Polyangiaceae bacterium]|nr:hypothetical protein [Polyangiaceae bacterium]
MTAHLEPHGEPLRDVVGRWVDQGLAKARAGHLMTGRLQGGAMSPAHAKLTLESFAGVVPQDAGIPVLQLVSVGFEPGDAIHVGGTIGWMGTKLIAAAADATAVASDQTLHGARELLLRMVSCDALVTELVKAGPLPSSCEACCLTQACQNAVEAMWTRAQAASELAMRVS